MQQISLRNTLIGSVASGGGFDAANHEQAFYYNIDSINPKVAACMEDWEYSGLSGLYMYGFTDADKGSAAYEQKANNLLKIKDVLESNDHDPMIDCFMYGYNGGQQLDFATVDYDELYSAMQEFDKLMRDNGLNITAEDIWSDYVEGV